MSNHPALRFPLEARLDYAKLVASIVIIDDQITMVELDDLRVLCGQLALSEEHTAQVIDFAVRPDAGRTTQLFHHIAGSELRFALIIDLVVAALADGEYNDRERARVQSLARRLQIPDEQTAAIERKVVASARRRVAKPDISELAHDPDPLAGSLVAALAPTVAAFTAPVVAVWLASGGPRDLLASAGALPLDEPQRRSLFDVLGSIGLGFGPTGGVIVVFLMSLVAYGSTRLILARWFPDAR